ncbi:long-chain fatty acid--CoA ligase [bacterium]|nr:long-chain fatty acid--CoA ligase [bacterium]
MEVRTLNDIFFRATRENKNPKAFQRKVHGNYQGISAETFERQAIQAALGLQKLGLRPGDRVALIAHNRYEWALSDFGILLSAGINVPIYPTLLPEQILYIIQNSGSNLVICSDNEMLQKVLQIRHQLEDLREIILMDGSPDEAGVMSFEQLLELGESQYEDRKDALEELALSVQPDQACSFIYTSGTTGDPKGVILRHGNIVSNVKGAFGKFPIGGGEDSCLSFLPLSHIFERMAGYYFMLYADVSIAYAESIDTVPQNLIEVRPSIMVSVPRLYEKMYARILDAALSGSFIKKQLFFWAKKKGEQWAEKAINGEEISGGLNFAYGIAAKLVFSKLKTRTGGRLKFFVSGGAPLNSEIAKFFYAAGLPILEGYGLTETSPVITANTLEEIRLGSVGKPFPDVEVKIAEDGEIFTRGPHVMQGYYKDEEATRAALGSDGWFATGDVGAIDNDGFLSILDRKKDIIVTAGGKNIAPQPIENRFKMDKFLSECVLIGDKRNFISALLVPNFENLLRYAKEHDIIYTSLTGLVADPRIRNLYQRRVDKYNAELARFEQVKQFALLDKEMTIDGGELTPSMKVKRNKIEERYKELIDSLYEEAAAK